MTTDRCAHETTDGKLLCLAWEKYACESVVCSVSVDSDMPPSAPATSSTSTQLTHTHRHTCTHILMHLSSTSHGQKVAGIIDTYQSIGGLLISLLLALCLYVDITLNLWHVASVSSDLQSPSQVQSITALWLLPSDTAWWHEAHSY